MAERKGDDINPSTVHQGYGTSVFTNPVVNFSAGGSYDKYPAHSQQQKDDSNKNNVIGLPFESRPFTVSVYLSVDETDAIGLIFASSMIVLISAARICSHLDVCLYDNRFVYYAVAVGAVSMVISGFCILLLIFKPALASSYGHFVAIFLLIWWGIGASILTFNEPFLIVGNGYFGCWLGFATSASFAMQTVNYFSYSAGSIKTLEQDRRTVFFILIVSLIEIVAAYFLCDSRPDCSGGYAFAIVSGVLSACVCLIFLIAGGGLPIIYVAGFLLFWWMVAVAVLTLNVGDPFGNVGNGYFAVWCCFLESLYLCYNVFVTSPAYP